MLRSGLLIAICGALSSCQFDAERLPLAPLPQDGTVLPYQQVISRLKAQINSAKDAHFLEQWDVLETISQRLAESSSYLMRSADLPIEHRARIQKDSVQINNAIRNLQKAAKTKNQPASLEMIRLLHNTICDLEEIK